MSQSIAVLGGGDAPLSYPVALDGTITVLAAAAAFNGATALDDFQPCVTFYDNDSNLIARAVAPFIEQGGAGRRSWFRDTLDPEATAASDNDASLPPHIDLNDGCSIVFEAVTYDGSAVANVVVSNAMLRADISAGAA